MTSKQPDGSASSPLSRLLSGIGQMAASTVEYGKEVVSGQKLWEGLNKNDGAVGGWLSHGANELATVLLTGNPAPVYTRSMSPPDQDQGVEGTGVDSPDVLPLDTATAAIESHAQARQVTHHEVTVNKDAGEDMQETLFQSSLSSLVDRVRSLSPEPEPQKEIEP